MSPQPLRGAAEASPDKCVGFGPQLLGWLECFGWLSAG